MRGIAIAAVAVMGAAWAQAYAPGTLPRADIPAADTGDYGAIRSIAIVSALGPEFRITDAKAEKQTSLQTDWSLDGLAAATLRRYLAGRFAIVEPAADAASLRQLPTPAWLARQPDAGVDAWLVVRPVGDPTPGPAGLGVHIGQGAALCANYQIELIDVRRGVSLGKAVSRMQDHWGTPAAFACYQEDASLLADLKRGPKAETLDALHRQLEVLVPRSLVETLRALNLGANLPPPGDHSIAPPEAPADTSGIASVAVASAIGDGFSFVNPRDLLRAGQTVVTSVPDWGLDAEVERIAASALAGKFAVKSAAIDRAALARVELQERKHPRIDGLPPSAEVDAYVLIVKAYRQGTQSKGAGLWNEGLLTRSTYAYVNYAVVLVDARTLKVLKAALPVMKPESDAAFPLKRVANELWPEGAKDAAAAQKAQPVVRSLVADSLPETLYQMGLAKD